jgi:integrase
MFKNVSLRKRSFNGHPTWVLLGPDGQPIPAFSAFAKALRNDAVNTLDSYARHLAEFLDYLIEVSVIYGGTVTKLNLSEAIEAYGDYLQSGVDASKEIARKVAAQLHPGLNSSASLVPKMAAIRRFLRLSEEVRKEMAELARVKGDVKVPIDGDPLLPGFGQRRALEPFEVRAMQANSMLAGVIAGGPKFIDSVVFDGSVSEISYEQSRAFPYDKAMELIDSMPTYRDKALYAFLAASGCRTHEALQLLMEDMDVIEGTVRLVQPKLRIGHASYRALSAEQRASLAWKGRTTQLTLLIEPFASKFFESLKEYFNRERIAHGRHDFVFQYIAGKERGMPYFLSAAASRLEPFHRVCTQIGVDLPRGTAGHSLRHMYGTYLLNYFPRANGDYGLPAPMVQQLMGHASLKSTLKYARYDQDLLKLEIENANRVLFSGGVPKKLIDLKLAALEFQVGKLRNQMNQEAIAHG